MIACIFTTTFYPIGTFVNAITTSWLKAVTFRLTFQMWFIVFTNLATNLKQFGQKN